MGLYEQAWNGSAEFKSLASKEQASYWDEHPGELLDSPDLAKKVFGIMLRLTITPEVVTSKAHNYLEDAGLIKSISEPFGAYKQHILISLPQARDPQFLGLKNGSSVDQQKVYAYDDKEYFQPLVNVAVQIPLTLLETEFRQAFTSEAAMSSVLSAKREGVITSFRLQTLYNEFEAISKALTPTMALQTTQTVEMQSEVTEGYDFTDQNYAEFLGIIRALTYNLTHYFTGQYNQANFPSMENSADDLIMLVRAPITRQLGLNNVIGNIPIDLFKDVLKDRNYDWGLPFVEVPNFGGLTGFTPSYNEQTGQQETAPAIGDSHTDPHADVLAIITTNKYFVKNTVIPFSIQSAPYNAAGMYVSQYGNYLGGIQSIGYEPFIVIKKKTSGAA